MNDTKLCWFPKKFKLRYPPYRTFCFSAIYFPLSYLLVPSAFHLSFLNYEGEVLVHHQIILMHLLGLLALHVCPIGDHDREDYRTVALDEVFSYNLQEFHLAVICISNYPLFRHTTFSVIVKVFIQNQISCITLILYL